MPTYAYRCPSCGHEFEKFQKITDPPRARCPRCRATAERVITGGSGFLLKGTGFYSTDYRSESYKRAAKSESGGESGAGASAAEKPESAGGARGAPDVGRQGGGATPPEEGGAPKAPQSPPAAKTDRTSSAKERKRGGREGKE